MVAVLRRRGLGAHEVAAALRVREVVVVMGAETVTCGGRKPIDGSSKSKVNIK